MASPANILLADDEETFLEATRDLLCEEGFVCHGVRTAGELSEALSSVEFDLLITDLKMPGNRVLEMVDDIRRQARVLPVIVVTGYPSVPSAVESVRLNVLEYMIKPVAYPVLLDAVRRGLKLKQVLGAVRRAKEEAEQRAQHLMSVEQTLSESRNIVQASEVAPQFIGDSRLQELQSQVDKLTQFSGMDESSTRIPISDYYRLREGLYDTIQVLHHTKNAFRSKDLANLRAKLEKLLKETLSGSP